MIICSNYKISKIIEAIKKLELENFYKQKSGNFAANNVCFAKCL